MKLKPIPAKTVVHTTTEAEAKELLAILHENGWKWINGNNLTEWISSNEYLILNQENQDASIMPPYVSKKNYVILTLDEFKERYCEKEKPTPKFDKGQKVRITNKKHPHYGHKGKIGEVFSYDPKYDRYMINGIPSEWESGDLEPYTEPEPNDEAKETKESEGTFASDLKTTRRYGNKRTE